MQYNSILYGNGLTISLLSEIGKITSSSIKKYLSCDCFINDLLHAEPHNRILRDFNKYFIFNSPEVENTHKNTREFLKSNLNEICKLGFERWISKYILSDNFPKNLQPYLYIMYNHWFALIHKEILTHYKEKKFLQEKSEIILTQITDKDKIYTINFDNILDDFLQPEHLHGRFQFPLKDFNEIILKHYNDREFEYKYLFGGTGSEKIFRLANINKLSQSEYNLSFFNNNRLDMGHLLIYGVSFGRAEILSDDFLAEYPEHKDFTFAYSVDGHIIEKLIQMYNEERLEKMTLSFYSPNDKIYYDELFGKTELNKIIDYKP